WVPPPSPSPGPSSLVWKFRGTLHRIKKKKWRRGHPKNPYQTLIRAHNLAGRRKRGGMRDRPPPEPYQATCPQHPPKAPCPHVDGDKGLIPISLAQWLWGYAVGGLIGIWKPPLTRGPPDPGPPCELVTGTLYPYHFTKKSFKNSKKDRRHFGTSPLLKNKKIKMSSNVHSSSITSPNETKKGKKRNSSASMGGSRRVPLLLALTAVI
ncbi:hypothetical protein AB205_0049960, partial [Aquarana catesbeiana]